MPSTSKKQQRFMYAMLAQQEKTGHNKTGMSTQQLKDFTHLKKDDKSSSRKKLLGKHHDG